MYFFKTASLGLVTILGYISIIKARSNCDVSRDVIPLGQSGLAPPPAGQVPINIALGIGTQNYTCNSAGTFTSIGAVAILYDASCVSNLISNYLSDNSTFLTESTTPFEVIHNMLQAALGHPPEILGHHFFVANATGTPANSISPTFDFRAGIDRGNPNAFVITSKTGDVKAPVDPTDNVDWLQLTAIPGDGDLASTVYRILTLGGQPPASCTPNSGQITVPYAANYWFFK